MIILVDTSNLYEGSSVNDVRAVETAEMADLIRMNSHRSWDKFEVELVTSKDAIIREIALQKLTEEERRVLGV